MQFSKAWKIGLATAALTAFAHASLADDSSSYGSAGTTGTNNGAYSSGTAGTSNTKDSTSNKHKMKRRDAAGSTTTMPEGTVENPETTRGAVIEDSTTDKTRDKDKTGTTGSGTTNDSDSSSGSGSSYP